MINQTLLYLFFEGKTSVDEEVMIKEWLEESAQHKEEFLKERKLFDAIVLVGKLEETHLSEKPAKRSYRFFREIIKIAAVSAIALLISYLYQESQKERAEEQYQTISVPAGQRINLTLPDGTDVWLNARTTIRYPLSFNKERREIILDGEAYFEVSKDEKKPFVIQTPRSRLEVLGTAFNVEDYSDKDYFETMLFNGSVKISSKDGIAQTITLTPTHKAYLEKGRLTVAQVDDYSAYRWREGLICFKDESFATIMSDFEKYYGLSIQIENENVQKQHYSGKFRQADGIDYALRVLQKDIHFTYQRNDDNNIIYIQ